MIVDKELPQRPVATAAGIIGNRQKPQLVKPLKLKQLYFSHVANLKLEPPVAGGI